MNWRGGRKREPPNHPFKAAVWRLRPAAPRVVAERRGRGLEGRGGAGGRGQGPLSSSAGGDTEGRFLSEERFSPQDQHSVEDLSQIRATVREIVVETNTLNPKNTEVAHPVFF